jgi:hypothetical protein
MKPEKDDFSAGLSKPNRFEPASKVRFTRLGRCVPSLFCRVTDAVGKARGGLKSPLSWITEDTSPDCTAATMEPTRDTEQEIPEPLYKTLSMAAVANERAMAEYIVARLKARRTKCAEPRETNPETASDRWQVHTINHQRFGIQRILILRQILVYDSSPNRLHPRTQVCASKSAN